MNALNIWSNKR